MPSSVIGLDLGGSLAKVAQVEEGGVVVLNNELSSRSTPSVISMPACGARLMGASAVPHLVTHAGNSVCELRNLLGTTKYLKNENWSKMQDAEKVKNDGIRISIKDQRQTLQPEQLVAAFLGHLNNKVVKNSKDAFYVLSVPHYFTDVERTALQDAAKIANIKVVDMVNDLTSAALAYGYFQKDQLPGAEDQVARQVVIVDFGYSAVQAALVEFTKSGFKVLNVQSDRSTGSRQMDHRLAEKFASEFQSGGSVSKRSMTKLLNAAERAKKLMSASKNTIPVTIECLQNDMDFNGKVSREEFESLNEDLFGKIKTCLQKLAGKVDVKDLHSVEIIGGSSRIPKFKEIVEEVFGQAPKTTLNADEAVAKGAALQCAMKTPVYSVRDFKFKDVSTAFSTIQAKHSVLKTADSDDDNKMESDDNMTVCTNVVETSKTHKIFLKNDSRLESSITLKARPDGDTVAIEYEHPGCLSRSLIAIYQLEFPEDSTFGGDETYKLVLSFKIEQGKPYLRSAVVKGGEKDQVIGFKETRVGGLPATDLQKYQIMEEQFQADDMAENQRQEFKNQVEDCVFSFKDALSTTEEKYGKEECWTLSMEYVEHYQNIVDNSEEYPNYSSEKYQRLLREIKEKREVFELWKAKFQAYLECRKRRVSDEQLEQQLPEDKLRQHDDEEPRFRRRNHPTNFGGHGPSPPARFMNFFEDSEDDFWNPSGFYRRRRQPQPNFYYMW